MFAMVLGTYKAWVGLAVISKILSMVLRLLGLKLSSMFKIKAPSKLLVKEKNVEILVSTEIHDTTTQNPVHRDWFSLRDIFSRLSLALISFYYGMVVKPVHFLRYTFIYNKIHNGMAWAFVASLMLPFWPFILPIKTAICCLIKGNSLDSLVSMIDTKDEDLDSLRFFTNQLNPLNSFLYDFMQEFTAYTANFYIIGPSVQGIQTMYWDTPKTTKMFWRGELSKSGAQVPKKVGFWDGTSAKLCDNLMENSGLVIKITDSCMGVGDKFLKKYKDYESKQDVIDLLSEKYQGKECLILELVKPLSSLGVHSLDILTAKDNNGDVQLIDVIVWTGSKTSSSHAATDAYMIDPLTGTSIQPAKWYNPNFVDTSLNGLGVVYPGVALAVLKVVEAHRNIPYSWLPIIGWDAMVTENSDLVFFEGNLAAWRCPRRLYLSFKNLVYFVSYISWVGK